MQSAFCFYVGVDWATQTHRVCVMDAKGEIVRQQSIEHVWNQDATIVTAGRSAPKYLRALITDDRPDLHLTREFRCDPTLGQTPQMCVGQI